MATSMEPLSARLPSELYAWLASLKVEGATTMSDKLRILLQQVQRQRAGATDFVSAYGMLRDSLASLDGTLLRLDGQGQGRSEVLHALMEHALALMAVLQSTQPQDRHDAQALEEQLVRRSCAALEQLLRQALTPSANAFDPHVVRQHLHKVLELAHLIHPLQES